MGIEALEPLKHGDATEEDALAVVIELGRGELWKASVEAVDQASLDPLRDWWDALTKNNPVEPVYVYLDKLGDKGKCAPTTGTFAMATLACATLAAVPWAAAMQEFRRRDWRWPDEENGPRAEPLDAALETTWREFTSQRSARHDAGKDGLSSPWPTFLRQRVLDHRWPAPITGPWAWDAICQLWGVSAPHRRSTTPVAAYVTGGKGALITLVVETLQSDLSGLTPRPWHDPKHAFATAVDRSCIASIERAFNLALANGPDKDARVCGRWRVFDGCHLGPKEKEGNATPTRSCAGTSAGGAALYAWSHALRGWHADAGVIVMAAVDQTREALVGLVSADPSREALGKEQVTAKVVAIADSIEIDTIVVASRRDAGVAFATIGHLKQKNPRLDIRIVLFEGDGVFLMVGPDKFTPLSLLERHTILPQKEDQPGP